MNNDLLKRFEEVVRENERLKEELRLSKTHTVQPYSVPEQFNPLYRPWYVNQPNGTIFGPGIFGGGSTGTSTITVNPGMATQTTIGAKF